LRYAYKVDIDLRDSLPTGEHRGEGWGFWRIVEPYISAKDAEGAQGITDLYDLGKDVAASTTTEYYYYCMSYNVLMNALPDGVSAEDIGTLEGTDPSSWCSGVTQSPPVGDGVTPSPPPDGVEDCTCSCCTAAECPTYTYGTFYSGGEGSCTVDMCRSYFYFCPDSGSHSDGSEVNAVYGTGTAGVSYTLAGSTYTPVNNVAGNRDITDDICSIKDLLSAGNWDSVRDAYKTGADGSSATVVLQNLATEDWTDTAQYDLFSQYYGDDKWIDTGALATIDGTGVWTDESARQEGTEKTLMNALLTSAALNNLADAINQVSNGETAEYQAVKAWDKGWAYYTGATQSCAPYATADKRAGNYGTYSTTTGLESTSKANEAILAALVDGQAAVQGSRRRSLLASVTDAQDAYDTILQNIQITYIQASLRYAYKVDIDLRDNLATGEHRGEGWGFWRIVEPYISEKDSDGAQGITDLYDLGKQVKASDTTDYYYYCMSYNVMMNALPDGVTSADIGTLEGTDPDSWCGDVTQSPPASTYIAPSPPPAVSDDCTCSCCQADGIYSCPNTTQTSYGSFYAGSEAACNEDACRSEFYFCPDTGSHNDGDVVTAYYAANGAATTSAPTTPATIVVEDDDSGDDNDAVIILIVVCVLLAVFLAAGVAYYFYKKAQGYDFVEIGKDPERAQPCIPCGKPTNEMDAIGEKI
jgi:hypothetical protein